jgi:hypothetical protein
MRVPIYLMTLDSVPAGVTRDVAYVLTLGTSKIWTGIHSIKIGATQAPPAGAAVTSITVIQWLVSLLLFKSLKNNDITH